MKSSTFTILLLVLSILGTSALQAQVTTPRPDREYGIERTASDFTDEEVERYGNAMRNIEALQNAAQLEIELMLQTHGLDQESFKELASRIQDRDAKPKPTDEERTKFFKINEEMQAINMGMEPKVMQVLADERIEVLDFQDLNKVYEMDEAFRERVNSAMRN